MTLGVKIETYTALCAMVTGTLAVTAVELPVELAGAAVTERTTFPGVTTAGLPLVEACSKKTFGAPGVAAVTPRVDPPEVTVSCGAPVPIIAARQRRRLQ